EEIAHTTRQIRLPVDQRAHFADWRALRRRVQSGQTLSRARFVRTRPVCVTQATWLDQKEHAPRSLRALDLVWALSSHAFVSELRLQAVLAPDLGQHPCAFLSRAPNYQNNQATLRS